MNTEQQVNFILNLIPLSEKAHDRITTTIHTLCNNPETAPILRKILSEESNFTVSEDGVIYYKRER